MARPSKLYRQWSLEMRRRRLFLPGERVGVAVSGGPDSILLLHFMKQYSQDAGLSLAVVHFNHHLRGAESDSDEQFVSAQAARLRLEVFRGEARVARAARSSHRNVEATARELRYRFFFSLIHQGRLNKVATGHTASDQAETVLLRLLRGSGTRGFGGIYPILDGVIIRPFLTLTRAEIETEISERGLDFHTDASNLDVRFTRNRVRQRLLPLLEKEFNPEIVPLLAELASRSRDDEAFLQESALERARPWRRREGDAEKIPLRALLEYHPAIERRVLREMILSARGSLLGITSEHIEALRRFAISGQSGKKILLPHGLEARREFEWLAIGAAPKRLSADDYEFSIIPPAEILIPQINIKFLFHIAENPASDANQKKYNSVGAVWIDMDKLPGGLVLRNWRPGDRFQPLGTYAPLKLKALFLKRRVPLRSRHLWPVLVCGQEVVWVHQFPPAHRVNPSPASARALVIEERQHLETGETEPLR
jgi:tRNA(Ile)-lysidine synthase